MELVHAGEPRADDDGVERLTRLGRGRRHQAPSLLRRFPFLSGSLPAVVCTSTMSQRDERTGRLWSQGRLTFSRCRKSVGQELPRLELREPNRERDMRFERGHFRATATPSGVPASLTFTEACPLGSCVFIHGSN